jgi:HTH-type transcriptional regulator/antitoxin HipB
MSLYGLLSRYFPIGKIMLDLCDLGDRFPDRDNFERSGVWVRELSRSGQSCENNSVKTMAKVTNAMEIGKLVRIRRKEAGLTLKDAAGMAGVGIRFLSELERGKSTIQLGRAIEVLQLFGLELHVRVRGARS